MFKIMSIEYCVEWNYLPKAASLAEAVEAEFGVKPVLIKSGGGVFEVEVDGDLVFSKKKEFRFPQHQEIIDILKNR